MVIIATPALESGAFYRPSPPSGGAPELADRELFSLRSARYRAALRPYRRDGGAREVARREKAIWGRVIYQSSTI